MKIGQEHVRELKEAILVKYGSEGVHNVISGCVVGGLSPMRARWDFIRAVKGSAGICEYYKIDGVHDDHIDTMLRKVFSELGSNWAAQKCERKSS